MPNRDPTRSAIERLSDRLTKDKDLQNERIDSLLDRLNERFDRLEAKVDLKVDKLASDTQREIDEARRDVGELRDLVAGQGKRIDTMESTKTAQLRASAEGAALGAGYAVGEAAAATAKVTAAAVAKGFWSTWAGKIVALGTAIAALGAGIDNLPKVLKWAAQFFQYLAGAK
jgi:FtsZ-binding cell division protein ZapB